MSLNNKKGRVEATPLKTFVMSCNDRILNRNEPPFEYKQGTL
jgi:hypothetical protein